MFSQNLAHGVDLTWLFLSIFNEAFVKLKSQIKDFETDEEGKVKIVGDNCNKENKEVNGENNNDDINDSTIHGHVNS